MTKTQETENEFTVPVIIGVLTLIILAGGLYLYGNSSNRNVATNPDIDAEIVPNPSDDDEDPVTPTPSTPTTPTPPAQSSTMTLYLYQQDTAAAATSDCRVTKRVARQVPRTTALADTSLRILFNEELSRYGTYQSVSVTNGVARVMLASDTTPAGTPISSLSSCESGHLMAVISDTLTQYSTVNSVVLHSPNGQITF